jgi:hypothetical protein
VLAYLGNAHVPEEKGDRAEMLRQPEEHALDIEPEFPLRAGVLAGRVGEGIESILVVAASAVAGLAAEQQRVLLLLRSQGRRSVPHDPANESLPVTPLRAKARQTLQEIEKHFLAQVVPVVNSESASADKMAGAHRRLPENIRIDAVWSSDSRCH